MNLARELDDILTADPGRIVLRSTVRKWTSAEFDAVTRCVAEGLARRGVGRGDVVELRTDDHTEAILLMTGVFRAGAAFCVIPPTYPARRVEAIRSRVGPVMAVSSVEEVVEAANEPAPTLAARDDSSLTYVIFTSGSTGDPKAVEITDRGLHYLISQRDLYHGSTIGHTAALQFDACIYEIFGGLFHSMTIAVLDIDDVTDRSVVSFALRDVDSLFLTTQLFNLLADRTPQAFDDLDTVIFGGERVSPAHVRKVVGRCRVLHAYGPTETTVYATIHEVLDGVGDDVPIGRGLMGSCLHVVDEAGEQVEAGQIGELLIGGDGLMRGYRGQPEATRDALLDKHGEPHYRTGDLVRCDDQEVLTYAGRKDRQLKVSGHRIDPLEIERVAAQFNETGQRIGRAIVVGDDRRLRLFVTGCTDVAALRSHLRATLPVYMVPVVTSVGYIPLNDNGKTDVAELLQRAKLATPRQEAARQVFTALLPQALSDSSASFVDLGGDSLRAMEALWRLDQQGIRIDMAAVLTEPLEEVLRSV